MNVVYTNRRSSDNPAVRYFEFFHSPKHRGRWDSWWGLYMALPFVFGLVFLIPEQLKNADVGTRQQVTSGIVTAYEPSNHDTCRYRFVVQGTQYDGASSCSIHPGVIGSQVEVYYDPVNPSTSSLEDFLATYKRNAGFIRLLIFGICAVIAAIIYAKLKSHFKASHRT